MRAKSAVDRGIRYKLGHGGFYPKDPLPSRDGYCDCSGFVAWVLQMSRRPKIGRWWWIETTNVWNDATKSMRVFQRIGGPRPGCIVVYPDSVNSEGHIGIVSGIAPLTVIDCSASANGIFERSGRVFEKNKNTIFCMLK